MESSLFEEKFLDLFSEITMLFIDLKEDGPCMSV
jgi:hypothetical protein